MTQKNHDNLSGDAFTIYWEGLFADVRNKSEEHAYPESARDIVRAYKMGLSTERIAASSLDFRNCDLRYIDFERCAFRNCTFDGANLTSMNARHAQFESCTFVGAHLSNADFSHTDMLYCYFTNADLESVALENTDIRMSEGLKIIMPVGSNGRLVYAYTRAGKTRIQAGCRNATPRQMRKAIKEDYNARDPNYDDYMTAVSFFEAWGKREKLRLAALESED